MAILAAVLELVYIYQSKESAENRKQTFLKIFSFPVLAFEKTHSKEMQQSRMSFS